GDEVVVVGRKLSLSLAAFDRADQAIIQIIVRSGLRRDRAAEIEVQITIAEGIDSGLDIVLRRQRRSLADDVDDTTGATAAVENGRRPAQDVDPFDAEGREFPGCEAEAEKLQAIQEQADVLRIETADLEPVVTGVGAEGLGADARRIAQCLG